MSGSSSERRNNKHGGKHGDNRNTKKNIEKKSSGSKGFPWITGCFVLLIAICGAAVTYDIQTASSYDKSHTAFVTKNALEYGSCAWHRSLAASARGFLWMEKNTPYYYATVADFSKPYVELASDMSLVITNQAKELIGNVKEYAVTKWPVVYSTVDEYAPGALDATSYYISQAWDGTKVFCTYYYNVVATYFTTKVFVDNWAPDVLHAKTLQALNTTQLYALEYYNRFHKNVDHYSKL